MNKSQFQQINQYVGPELLNYILNHEHITDKSDYDQLVFSTKQIQVLDDLHERIQQCRIQFIIQGGYGDGVEFYLRQITLNGTSLFNYYRIVCDGLLTTPTASDSLVAYLQEVCIREYPNLLMKSSREVHALPLLSLNLGMSDYNTFIDLVKNDIIDQITNGKDGFEYAFQFSTDDGLNFSTQVCIACSTLITRSFYDSCNRMNYSLSSVLKTIESNVDVLRCLAKGQKINYSSFIGIRGIQFIGFDAIEFPDAVLRQFSNNANPSIHTSRTVVHHSDDEIDEYSGHVFEIRHSTKIASTTENINTSNSLEINKIQEAMLQKLRFAIVFSSLANHGPVPTCYEVGFPLITPGNFGFSESYPISYIKVDETIKEELINWYCIISDKNLQKVYTPLKRLQYAIFERKNPEDAIIDAIIAWEGMFSEAFETTFKVSGSMAKYLRSGREREDLFKRLKDLYQLRSSLVHGGDAKLLRVENINNIRAEVIGYGLECLMKIIKDDRLLLMDSSERIKNILVFDKTN